MTDKDQIKAIAELDGMGASYSVCGCAKDHSVTEVAHGKCQQPFEQFKDYLHSYDAIIPVIQKKLVAIQLSVVEVVDIGFHDELRSFHLARLLNLKPQQLCEALLRATGKWIE